MKTLIIVDMQNDFITGSLANPAAQAIVKPICDYINKFKGNIILTRDTHNTDYLNTQEGKNLPIEHCIEGTAGWCVNDDIIKAVRNKKYEYLNKPTFGYIDWGFHSYSNGYCFFGGTITLGDEIILVGTCTDICVISNALILKAKYPDKKITVLKDLCAGLTKELHEAALEVMRSCQIEVK